MGCAMTDPSSDPQLSLALPPEAMAEPGPGPGEPITGVEYPPPVPGIGEASTSPKGRWTVGTLSYTVWGLAGLFILLLGGDFAYAVRERSVGPVVQLMLRRLHASDTTMAFYFSTIPTALTLVISPIVSYKSDRYRSRWGRRIPFLLIPTPIAAASIFGIGYVNELGAFVQHLLWLPPSRAGDCALGCFAVLWTAFEVATVTAAAVFNGLVNDVVPRPMLGRFFGLFRQVSLGAGIIFNYWVLGQAEVHYRAVFIGISVVFFVGFTVMCVGVREGEYSPPPPISGVGQNVLWNATRQYFQECFSLAYYRWLFVGMTLAYVAFTPVNLFSLLFAKQINVSMQTYGHLLAYSYFISFFLASPLGWLVDRAHTLRVTMATLLVYGVLMLGFGFIIHSTWTFGLVLVLHTVLSGCYWTVSAPLGQALFPRMSFAQYASASGIVTSLFTIAFGMGMGAGLDATGHAYRLTYFLGGVLALSGLLTLLVVHGKFMRLGGPRDYVAPQPRQISI
jgi:MFS family permease